MQVPSSFLRLFELEEIIVNFDVIKGGRVVGRFVHIPRGRLPSSGNGGRRVGHSQIGSGSNTQVASSLRHATGHDERGRLRRRR